MVLFLILLMLEGVPLLNLQFSIGQRLRNASVRVCAAIKTYLTRDGKCLSDFWSNSKVLVYYLVSGLELRCRIYLARQRSSLVLPVKWVDFIMYYDGPLKLICSILHRLRLVLDNMGPPPSPIMIMYSST